MKRALIIIGTFIGIGAIGWWFFVNNAPLAQETRDSFSLQYTTLSADTKYIEDVEMDGDRVIITIQDNSTSSENKVYRVLLTEQQQTKMIRGLMSADLSQVSIKEISSQEERETESLIMVWKENGVEHRIEKKVSSISEVADAQSAVRWKAMQRVLKQVIDAAKKTAS